MILQEPQAGRAGEEKLDLPCDANGASKQLKTPSHEWCCPTSLALPYIYPCY